MAAASAGSWQAGRLAGWAGWAAELVTLAELQPCVRSSDCKHDAHRHATVGAGRERLQRFALAMQRRVLHLPCKGNEGRRMMREIAEMHATLI